MCFSFRILISYNFIQSTVKSTHSFWEASSNMLQHSSVLKEDHFKHWYEFSGSGVAGVVKGSGESRQSEPLLSTPKSSEREFCIAKVTST